MTKDRRRSGTVSASAILVQPILGPQKTNSLRPLPRRSRMRSNAKSLRRSTGRCDGYRRHSRHGEKPPCRRDMGHRRGSGSDDAGSKHRSRPSFRQAGYGSSKGDYLEKAHRMNQHRLQELMSYEPATGKFIWLDRPNAPMFRYGGKEAGSVNNKGYVSICVEEKRYLAHRLAWLYMTGVWPSHEIDHRNRDKQDNSWINLCDASHIENCHNKGIASNNTSGARGVSKHRNKWQARIRINYKLIHLGVFDTYEDAVAARRAAETNLKLP